MWFLLEVGRFHNVLENKPTKWSIAKKKKTDQNIQPTTNSYDFAKRSGHWRYIIKLSIK
jgi:hypothetical protein